MFHVIHFLKAQVADSICLQIGLLGTCLICILCKVASWALRCINALFFCLNVLLDIMMCTKQFEICRSHELCVVCFKACVAFLFNLQFFQIVIKVVTVSCDNHLIIDCFHSCLLCFPRSCICISKLSPGQCVLCVCQGLSITFPKAIPQHAE